MIRVPVSDLLTRLRISRLILLVLFLVPGCGEKDPFPFAVISAVTPSGRVAGFSSFDLTVTGTGFVSSSVVNFRQTESSVDPPVVSDTELPTTFVSSTKLIAQVDRSLTLDIGDREVIVKGPDISGEETETLPFSIRDLDFSVPLNLTGDGLNPAIAVDESGPIHVVWEESSDIFYRRSTDNGETFSAAVNLSNSPAGISEDPSITVDSQGNIHVLWVEDVGGPLEVFYRRSLDSGLTFSVPSSPLTPKGASATPVIETGPGDVLHVVWDDFFEIYHSQSVDGGGTFSAGQNLSNTILAGPAGFSATPAMAADGLGNINIVWEEDFEILFRRSTDGGTSFSTALALSDMDDGFSVTPDIAVDKDNVMHVVWDQDFFIYTSRSFDNGSSFDLPFLLSSEDVFSIAPKVVSDAPGNIHYMWDEDLFIIHIRSPDNGDTFPYFNILTDIATRATTPDLAVDADGHTYMV
ncbi:MAG TPA: sialidase family protein, partial [Nitrospiria bacterium]|nr:sialidase family protein [Nitrospiria bacterium]